MKKIFEKFKEKKLKAKVLTIILVIGVVFGGTYLLVKAQEIIDSFSNTSKTADTWNVEVDTTAGEVKLEAKTCNDTDWFCSANNICASTLGDGDYIVVARTDISTTQQYKDTDTACDQPHCSEDGAQSTDSLVADNTVNFANYPARQACKNIGGRLPTKTELVCIYTNRTSFGNNFGTSLYWSATEYDSTYAWFIRFADGFTYYTNKTFSYSVRCVVGW